jgi:hypothetical protein
VSHLFAPDEQAAVAVVLFSTVVPSPATRLIVVKEEAGGPLMVIGEGPPLFAVYGVAFGLVFLTCEVR